MAAPRFAAYVPFPATTLTLNTNAGGDASGTLPAGVYANFGVGSVSISTGSGSPSATLPVTSGDSARFNVGDTVDVYDISGDTTLVSGAVIQSKTATSIVIDSSVAYGIDDRIYLTGSLFGTIEAVLAATDVASSSERVRVQPSGSDPTRADVYYTGATGTLTLDAYTADVLRIGTSESLSTSGTVVSERSVLGSFAPSKTIMDDRPMKRRPGSTYVADNGTFRKLTIAQQVRHILQVRYRGGPRATDWQEIHAWEDLCDLLDAGYKFRLYRDTDTTTAVYARKTNPYGWQEWHVESGAEFEPRDPVGGTYDHWSQTLNLIEVT